MVRQLRFRRLACGLLLSLLLPGAMPPADALLTPRANLILLGSSASLTPLRDTPWTLEKTGLVDPTNQTVHWTVLATEGLTAPTERVINGVLRVRNIGTAPATLGNIVVNLQTRSGFEWITLSSNVADATQDDVATTAQVVPGASAEKQAVFSENAASGALVFMDASNNSVFSLVPQKTIAPGASVNLLYSARFDNTVLDLPSGQAVRAEVIVSFGNSGPGSAPNNGQNIDINGNGMIDADEDFVRSVPARITLKGGLNLNLSKLLQGKPTLTDTVDDITTTGTVTFTNPVFALTSPSGGTVTVSYDGGASGGTITNCAHLTSPGKGVTVSTPTGSVAFYLIEPVNLQACDTQVIGAHACPPGAVGCGWEEGDVITHTQVAWGDPNHPAGQLLTARFNTVYASTGAVLEVGLFGAAGFSMAFTTANAVLAYQPALGAAAALNGDLVDPMTTSSGVFGGEVVALQLNIDFSDAGYLAGASGLAFGDLALCRFTALPGLNGTSVRAFLDVANTALGGGTTQYSIATLNTVAGQLNSAFSNGTVSTFAQNQLFNGACPP